MEAPPVIDEECESRDSTNSVSGEVDLPQPDSSQINYPVIFPAYFSPFFPFSFPLWPRYTTEATTAQEGHEVVKRMAVHSKGSINVDELVGMSKLRLGESIENSESSSLSLKLVEVTSRQSAFHANPSTSSSNVSSRKSPIPTV